MKTAIQPPFITSSHHGRHQAPVLVSIMSEMPKRKNEMPAMIDVAPPR